MQDKQNCEEIYKVLLVITLAIIGMLSVKFFHFDNDNFIEETSEIAIQEITGVKVDLTPNEGSK